MRLNKTLIKSLVVLVVFCGISGCDRTPDPQEDIALFEDFIAKNIDKVSDDPYISSTVKPGDKMYDFLVSLQHGGGGGTFLEPMLDKQDPEAMLWEGRLVLPVMRLRGKAYQLIHDSMLAGNPYAALELSEGSYTCQYYFGKGSPGSELAQLAGVDTSNDPDRCSKNNFTKAIEGFEVLAEQGDLRAQYFLLKQKGWDKSQDTRADYIHEVIRFAEQHYYQPLMDYVATILTQKKLSSPLVSKTPELEQLSINLLKVASNNNYIPAINKLIEFHYADIKKDDPLFDKGIKLGSGDTLSWKMLLFASDGYQNVLTPSERYFYGRLYERVAGSQDYFNLKFKEGSLSKDEMSELDTDVQNETITSMVYIDGFTSRDDWHPF